MNAHIRELLGRILSIFRKRELDDDFDEELASHIEMATEDNIRAGMNPQEARRQALIRFGGVDASRELHRDTRGLPLIENIIRDTRYALRMFFKKPGFSLAVIITLALCIGANSAIFSILDTLILKPLPFKDSDQIVSIYTSHGDDSKKQPGNISQYLNYKENIDEFSHLALWWPMHANVVIGDEAVRLNIVATSAEIFDVLGINPLLGGFFTKTDSGDVSSDQVILTYSFWKSYFKADPEIIGHTIEINGKACEVIGVAPQTFEVFDAQSKIIWPIQLAPLIKGNMGLAGQKFVGRLRPGAKVSTVTARMTALEQQAFDDIPPFMKQGVDRNKIVAGMDSLQSSRVEPDLRLKLYLLEGSVLFVLLIGCVNVINLFLSRANARQGELAVRISLGSGRKAITRQLFVESFLLTWTGSALGVALAFGIIDIINVFTARLLPKSLPFSIDSRMLLFTLIIATLTALIVGIFQAYHICGSNLLSLTRNQSKSVSNGLSLRRLSGGLVIAQIAVTLILLIGAGLLIHSFANILGIDPGFNPQQLISARIELGANYRQDSQRYRFRELLENSLKEIPGFKSVTLSGSAPYSDSAYTAAPPPPSGKNEKPPVFYLTFSADVSYLETMQIPLIEGRWFTAQDSVNSRPVCVVGQEFIRQYFPDENALGMPITEFEGAPEIIGVVGSIRDLSEEERLNRRFPPIVYRPIKQNLMWIIIVSVRSPRPAPEVIALIREKVREVDPALPLDETGSMESIISASLSERRAIMMLLCSFAGIALILSAVGIYGVLAYDVSKRTHEISIRGAIGATEKQIISMVLRQGLWKAGIGLLIGIIGAFYLSKFMASLLFEVKPIDPLTFILVSVLLLFVAVLASYIPARQASRVDPAMALRAE